MSTNPRTGGAILVLTRKTGQKIELHAGEINGEDSLVATVMVKEIRRNQVRIGFDAPDSIRIHREEVADDIRVEKGIADESEDVPDDQEDNIAPGEPDTCCVCGTESELGEHGLCASCQERTGQEIAHY